VPGGNVRGQDSTRLQLDPAQRDRLKKRFTGNPDAYEAFVLGASEQDKTEPGSGGEYNREAIGHFERAVELDPGYALAYARLANAYVWRDLFFEPGAGYLEKAKAAMAQADRLNPQLAETHMARYQLAWSHYQNFDIDAALRELRLARRLDPLSGYDELAILYAHIGLEDAFRREIERGRRIDPASTFTRMFQTEGFVLLGMPEEALRMAKENGIPNSSSRLPMALLSLGRYDEAREAAEALLRESPGHHNAVATRELVAVLSGERAADEAAIAGALESGKRLRDYHHTLYAIACIRAAQGDAKRVVDLLRRAAAAGMPDRTLFLKDPLLAPIRSSAEFAAFDAELEPVYRRYERESAAYAPPPPGVGSRQP